MNPRIKSIDIYDGKNPGEIPAYTLAEAARYLHLPVATLRSWVLGRSYVKQEGAGYFNPLIEIPDNKSRKLSFSNLVEAHILRSLRTKHVISVSAVRTALAYAQKELSISRLLLSKDLLTGAGDVFLDRYIEIINLSKSGQLVLKNILGDHLKRVEWDDKLLPVKLYPFLAGNSSDASKVVVIDPTISFGRPVLESKGISTAAVVTRIDAGESIEELSTDYDLDESEIEAAIYYEKAA